MPSPSKRRSSGRVIVSSPTTSCRRRSGRLSIISKPAQSSNVKVCIRVRPLSQKERGFQEGKEVIEIMDERILVFDPQQVHAPSFHRGRPTRDPTVRRNRNLKFSFGRVFGPESTNEQIFEETMQETLDSLMKGINCSVFAYGATGAGKTFTMLGTPTNKGVIARTVHELYNRIDAISEATICDVEVSYMEIYNETIRDLLTPAGTELSVQQDQGERVVIKGLTFHKPVDMDDLFAMLERGNSKRTQHPTDANKESSRSHAVFHIYLKSRTKTASVAPDVTMSKMALIDLAGSERASATGNSGLRFREGANINKSLLALGNCITALAEGTGKNFVPFRESKLTRILKDSLGGNCQTVMIAAVSSSAMSFDDSHNTLKYADRAQKIKVDLTTNVYRIEPGPHEYSKITEQQQREIQNLKQQVELLELEKRRLKREMVKVQQDALSAEINGAHGDDGSRLTRQQLEEMENVIQHYTQVQTQLLDVQSQRSMVQIKLAQKERSYRQLNGVLFEGKKDNARTRFERFQIQSQSQIERLATQMVHLEAGLREMKQIADGVFNAISTAHQNGHVGDNGSSQGSEIKTIIEAAKDRSEMCQVAAHNRHLQSMVDCLTMRGDQQDKIIEAMGALLKDQHLLLSSYNIVSPSMTSRFENVEKLLDGKQGVTWGDQNGHSATTSGLMDLQDCTIRKFESRNTSFTVPHPVNGLATLVANGAGDGMACASEAAFSQYSMADFRYEELPRPRLHQESDNALAINGYPPPSNEIPASIPPGTPPRGYPSVVPKGTPYRAMDSASSDDSDQSMDHENGHTAVLNGTFTRTFKDMATKTASGGASGDGIEVGRTKATVWNNQPMPIVSGPDMGRPSLPAWKVQAPKIAPRQPILDSDGFKKPPIPERLNKPRPPVEKPADVGTKAKFGPENTAPAPLSRKPSVTSITSVRTSPFHRSPSQSSLTNKTPDLPPSTGAGAGKGLKRMPVSSTNMRWQY